MTYYGCQGDDVVCLADYCDMFGCKVNAEDREIDLSTSAKKKFISLEKCSEEKVKKLQEDCLQLAQRYPLITD